MIKIFNPIKQLLLSNTIWVFVERISSSLLNLISIILIARFLGSEAYGQFAFAISVLGIALATGHLGLDGLLIKKLIQDQGIDSSLLGTVTLMKYIIYAPVTAGIILYAWISEALVRNESILLSLLALVCLVMPITSSLLAWLNAREEFRKISYRRIAAVLIASIIKISFILAGFDITKIAAVHIFMFILEVILLHMLFKGIKGPPMIKWQFNLATAKSLLSESGFLFLGAILAMIYINIDILMLRYFYNAVTVGQYAIIPQIIISMQLLPYAMTLVAFPPLIKKYERDKAAFKISVSRLIFKIGLLGTTATICTILLAPFFIIFLFGNEYKTSIVPLQVASLALPLIYLRQITTKLFICFAIPKQSAITEIITVVVGLILAYALIDEHQMLGAAIAVVLIYAITIVISTIFLYSKFKNISRVI